jgi:hypothetical protein
MKFNRKLAGWVGAFALGVFALTSAVLENALRDRETHKAALEKVQREVQTREQALREARAERDAAKAALVQAVRERDEALALSRERSGGSASVPGNREVTPAVESPMPSKSVSSDAIAMNAAALPTPGPAGVVPPQPQPQPQQRAAETQKTRPAEPPSAPEKTPGPGRLGAGPVISEATAMPLTSEQTAFFENKIRPILANHCLECHSAEKGKVKGGLNMDSREDLLRGGDNGVALKPGDLKASPLIGAVEWATDLQMPPKKKLSDEQIADLKSWVAMGAPDPRQATGAPRASKKDHWAFRPIAKVEPPVVKNVGWCKNPVDRFVLAKLEEKQMLPADPPETGSLEDRIRKKEALLRRAHFDLLGLPPTPEQIKAYVFDESPNAFEKVLDALLSSPQYGERWARHWMDTVRYSDTTGVVGNARGTDYRYAYAWGYRDWIIKSLNEDMPYDQFILNQLAADKIPNNPRENLAALGFLTVGQRFRDRDDILNDRIDVVSRGLLGLTVACARCHDHKFDPIKQADYYALRGVFASLAEPRGEGPVVGGDGDSPAYREFQSKLAELHQKAFATVHQMQQEESEKFRKNVSAYFRTARGLKDRTDTEGKKMADTLIRDFKLEARFVTDHLVRHFNPGDPVWGPFVKLLEPGFNRGGLLELFEEMQRGKSRVRYNPEVVEFLKRVGNLPGDLEGVAGLLERFYREKIDPVAGELFRAMANPATDVAKSSDKGLMEAAAFPLEVVAGASLKTQQDVMDLVRRWGLVLGGQLERRSGVNDINEFKLTARGGPVRAMIVEDLPNPIDSEIYPRGNRPKPGEKVTRVPRRFIEVLSPPDGPVPFKEGSGRHELARAIASPSNPLTARVMVNRVWMYHFGEGLVRTPDDLGNQSGQPTHPELLDYLADRFMEASGAERKAWSVKELHKFIMLSSAYQQDSRTPHLQRQQKMDAGNSLLWRAHVRRLDFEAVRDSMLSMAGTLEKTMYGPPVNLVSEPYSFRRSVYGYIDRSAVPDLLNQFDMASALEPNTKRTVSIVPQQALFLMNSPFSIAVAKSVANRPEVVQAFKGTEPNLRDRATIRAIFQIVLQRTPTRQEYEMALQFVREESKLQESVKAATAKLGVEAYDRAIKQVEQERNDSGARRSVVNEGTVVLRKPLSPWESLVQSLMFCNEAAYLN